MLVDPPRLRLIGDQPYDAGPLPAALARFDLALIAPHRCGHLRRDALTTANEFARCCR